MSGDDNRVVTADEVVELVRRYGEQRGLPLKCAAVLLEYEGGYPTETLLATPDRAATPCLAASS